MKSVTRQLQLLSDVLPWFLESMQELIDRSQSQSLPWADYASILTELDTLQPRVSDLILYSHRNKSQSEEECETTTTQLLSLLETWPTTGTQQVREKTKFGSCYEYPRLLAIQKNQAGSELLQPWSERERVEISDQLSIYAETLQKLDSRTQNVANYATTRSGRPPTGLRALLLKLHRTLGDVWNCRCRHPHDGMLLLTTHGGYNASDDGAKFSLLFGAAEGLTRWNEAQVFVMDAQDKRPRKRVKWSYDSSFFPPPPKAQATVSTICELLGSSEPERLLRLLVNGTSLREAELPARLILKVEDLAPSATFADLLQGPRLTFPCRIILAVIIAHTFLHLCGTSWMPYPWDKQSFKFLKSEQDLDIDEIIRPFLAARYGGTQKQSTLAAGILHKDQGRLALGVVLLEIFKQEPIEAFRKDSEDLEINRAGQVTTDTNLYAARRVLEESQPALWDGHELYYDAVRACFKPAEIDGRSWGDDEHSQYIYDNIVRPLECELECGCGISVSQLDKIIISRHGQARSLLDEYARPEGTTESDQDPAIHRKATAPRSPPPRHDYSIIPNSEKFLPTTKQESGVSQPGKARSCGSMNTSSRKRSLCDISSNELDSSVHDSSSDGTAEASAQDENLVSPLYGAHHSLKPSPLSMFHVQTSEKRNVGPACTWFDIMERNIHTAVLRRGTSTKAPIKVAILDTGVNKTVWTQWTQAKATKHRVSYRSFVLGDISTEPTDIADHGTHTAALLIRTAPNAHVFIAKISSGDDLDAEESISEAINHYTLKEKVDVISMSFGFSPREKGLEPLERAIERAHAKNIVMFAAGHNSGCLEKVAYPAAHEYMICVGSCDGYGRRSLFNPLSTSNMLCALGEDIAPPFPTTDQQTLSGTSFATPIAAGMAAVLMEYVSQESQSWSEVEQELAKHIRSKAGIEKILRDECCSYKADKYRVLKPMNLFEESEICFAKSLLLGNCRRHK